MSENVYIRRLATRLASAVIQDSDLNTDARALEVFTEGLTNTLMQASEAFVTAALLFRDHDGAAVVDEKEVQ